MAKEFSAKLNRRVLNADLPPIAIHHANFHRMGGEVVMDVGFHDMATVVRRLNELKAQGESATDESRMLEIDVTVIAQYAMGAETFARLRANVEEIYQAMVKSGDLEQQKPDEELK